MTETEEKLNAVKAKIKKFENSRTLIAGLFILLCYYVYDSFKNGTPSIKYCIAIGILIFADIGLFVYVSMLIRKLAVQRKELQAQNTEE